MKPAFAPIPALVPTRKARVSKSYRCTERDQPAERTRRRPLRKKSIDLKGYANRQLVPMETIQRTDRELPSDSHLKKRRTQGIDPRSEGLRIPRCHFGLETGSKAAAHRISEKIGEGKVAGTGPITRRFQRRGSASVFAACIVLIAGVGCSAGDDDPGQSSEAAVESTELVVAEGSFRASSDIALESGQNLQVDSVSDEQAVIGGATNWMSAASPTVHVSLGEGQQPVEPLTLSYTPSGGVHPPEGSFPVVVSKADDGTVDLVEARIEGDSLVADLPHLSLQVFGWLNPDNFGDEVTNTVRSALGTGSPQPDCVGEPLEYSSSVSTISPTENDVAWTCLYFTPQSNLLEPNESVQLTANSPYAWFVESSPAPYEINRDRDDVGNAYLRAIYEEQADGRSFLAPGQTLRMDFGQYQSSPDVGSLYREVELDKSAYLAWGYAGVLESIGFTKALDVALAMARCATVDSTSPAHFAESTAECLTGFAGSLMKFLLSKAAIQWISEIGDLVDSDSQRTAHWEITDSPLASSAAPSQLNQGSGTGAQPNEGSVVLGRPDNEYSVGYGTERPTDLSLNSMCANTITSITWDSWGGAEATGTGMLCAPAGDPDSGGPVTLVAADLGTCNGVPAYRSLRR